MSHTHKKRKEKENDPPMTDQKLLPRMQRLLHKIVPKGPTHTHF